MKKIKFLKNIYTPVFILFLYIPLLIMVIFSFNAYGKVTTFHHFSFGFQAYLELFTNPVIQKPIILTLVIGFLTTIISTFIGTAAAISISRLRSVSKKIALTINNIPIINADVVTGASLLVLFLSLSLNLGFFSVLFAHVAFCTPYVVVTVLTSIRNVDQSLIEASLDLGASPYKTLRKVILPLIATGILSGAALAFATSFDDFLVTYFIGGNVQNVSTYLYTQKLKALTPWVNAFSSLLMITIAIIFIIKNIINNKKSYYHNLPSKIKGWQSQINYFHEYKDEKIINNGFVFASKKEQNQFLKWEKDVLKIEQNFYKGTKKLNRYNKNKVFYKKTARFAKILLIIIPLSLGILLMSVYIKWTQNSINFGTFGSYFLDENMANFQRSTKINVNSITYDTNEELGVKLNTIKPDVFIASDYYLESLYEQEKTDPVDWSYLANIMQQMGVSGLNHQLFDGNFEHWFYPGLWQKATNYPLSNYGDTTNILNSMIPYYSGNLGIAYNHKNITDDYVKNVVIANDPYYSELDKNNPKSQPIAYQNNLFSWYSFLKIANDPSKKVIIYNDSRNFFMMGFSLITWNGTYMNDAGQVGKHKTANFNPYYVPECGSASISGSSINAKSRICIDKAYNAVTDFVGKHRNVRVLNDDIVDAVANGDFDEAMIYNGDLISAIDENPDITNPAYRNFVEYNLPAEGSNFWMDGLAISKNLSAKKKEQVYRFIAYFLQPQIQGTQAANTGYTPSGAAANLGMVKGYQDNAGSEDAYGVDGSSLATQAIPYLNPFDPASEKITEQIRSENNDDSIINTVINSNLKDIKWWDEVGLDEPSLKLASNIEWYDEYQLLCLYSFLNDELASKYTNFLTNL